MLPTDGNLERRRAKLTGQGSAFAFEAGTAAQRTMCARNNAVRPLTALRRARATTTNGTLAIPARTDSKAPKRANDAQLAH